MSRKTSVAQGMVGKWMREVKLLPLEEAVLANYAYRQLSEIHDPEISEHIDMLLDRAEDIALIALMVADLGLGNRNTFRHIELATQARVAFVGFLVNATDGRPNWDDLLGMELKSFQRSRIERTLAEIDCAVRNAKEKYDMETLAWKRASR